MLVRAFVGDQSPPRRPAGKTAGGGRRDSDGDQSPPRRGQVKAERARHDSDGEESPAF